MTIHTFLKNLLSKDIGRDYEFTAQQLDYINKWTQEKYSLTEIEKAYRTTVENTKKDPAQIPFIYLDKVLTSNRRPQPKKSERPSSDKPVAPQLEAFRTDTDKSFNRAEYEEKCALLFIYEQGLSEEYLKYMIGKDFLEQYGKSDK